jgi:hypothetical protein
MFYCDFTIAVTEEDARFCSMIESTPPEVVPHGVSKLILDDARDSEIAIDWSELPKTAVFVGYDGHRKAVRNLRKQSEAISGSLNGPCRRGA